MMSPTVKTSMPRATTAKFRPCLIPTMESAPSDAAKRTTSPKTRDRLNRDSADPSNTRAVRGVIA